MLIGIAPDGNSYQQICILLGRDDRERDRRLELSDWNQGQYVQTVPGPLQGKSPRPYPTMLSYDDQKRANRELHIVTTGDRTRAILATMLPDPKNGRMQSQPFGTGDTSYDPDPADPRHTPRVSGLLDIGVGLKNVYGLRETRRETHVNYNILTRGRYTAVNEYPLRSDAVAGTALAAHSYGPAHGDPTPFEGFPYLLPIRETAELTRDMYWELLPEEQRVAIAVMSIDGNERTYKIRNAA